MMLYQTLFNTYWAHSCHWSLQQMAASKGGTVPRVRHC